MFELKVDNRRGEIINLSASNNYTIYKITGLNPPQVTLAKSSNATIDGMNINNTRIEQRNIVLYIELRGNIEQSRIDLYKFFPIKKGVTIYFKNGSREVYIDGTVENIECDMFTKKEVAQISIICPRPYFKDINSLITNFGDISSLFSFPFEIESDGMELSEITSNVRKSIINNGDVDTGCIIKLFATGTVVDPVLYNVFTQEHLAFEFTMQSGDEITINTNPGEKSITLTRAGVSSNALGYMTPDSAWFILEPGDNLFTYDAGSGTHYLQIEFSSTILYGGV